MRYIQAFLGFLLIVGVILVFAAPQRITPPWFRVCALAWSILIAFYFGFKKHATKKE
jgi:hypothetical protein